MNKVILMGRLARDPEVRSTQSDKSVARMTIAVNRRVSKNAQQGQPTADFITLVAWERLADFCQKYLRKGTKILVEGRIQSRSYEGQDGSKRYVTEVLVSDIEFCESKKQEVTGPEAQFGSEALNDDDIPF